MNLYQLVYFLSCFIGGLILLYLTFTGLMSYKRLPNRPTLYLIAVFLLLAIMMFIYSLTPLLIEGQDFLAEITLGGGFILAMFVPPIYIEYFHKIYRKIAYISPIFYITVGGGFVMLFFQPWEIQYASYLHGFSHTFSDFFLIIFFIQLACLFFTMVQTFRVIKKGVDDELMNIDQIITEGTDNQELGFNMGTRKENLRGKNRILNYILFSYFLGICIICIGLLIPESFIDAFGVLLIAAPQAYFYSRDKEILVYLSAQTLREDTKDLQKKLSALHKQSTEFPQILETEIQSMVDFIEKADEILRDRDK